MYIVMLVQFIYNIVVLKIELISVVQRRSLCFRYPLQREKILNVACLCIPTAL